MNKIKFGKSQDNIKFGNKLLAGVRPKLMSPSEYFSRTYRITSKQKQQNTVPFLKDLVLASSQDPLTVRQNPVATLTQRDRLNLQQYETLENSAFSGLLQNSMAFSEIAARTDASLTKAILVYGEQCPPILYRAIKGIRASQLGLQTGMKFENAAWQSTTRSKQQALLMGESGTIFTLLIAPKLRVNVLDMTRFSSDKGKREVVLPKNATLQIDRIKEEKGEKPDVVIMRVSFPKSQVTQDSVTQKNYAGRHDQQMHTTLFNLANPSQGRRGSGRDKKDEERRAYAGAPQAATSSTISAVAVDPQPTNNSAIYRGTFTAETLALDESRYLSDLPAALGTELSHASALAIRTVALLRIKDADKADIKTYQDYLTRIYNAQLSGHMYVNPAAGVVTPATQTSTFEQLALATRMRQTPASSDARVHPDTIAYNLASDALQLSVAGKWTEAHERGRLALVKADQEVKEQIDRMPAIIARARERRGDELGVAIRLTREAQDVQAYTTLAKKKLNPILDNVGKEGNPYKSSDDFWKLHEQISTRLLPKEQITPQEERGRALFLSKGKELDRVTVEHFSELMRASTMAHNIEARVLAQIMSEDRIVSSWTSGSTQAGTNGADLRGGVESSRLGYEAGNMLSNAVRAPVSDGALRPVYGYVQIKNLQDYAHESLQGKYGHITATLRPAITPRVTSTPSDSLAGSLVGARGNVPFVPLDALRAGDPKSVRAFISNHSSDRQVNWIAVLRDARERGDRMKVSYKLEHQAYVELQIHSGMKPSRDISKLTVNVYDVNSLVRYSKSTEDSLRTMKQRLESMDTTNQNSTKMQQSSLIGLQIALKRGIPVTVLEAVTGMEVPLIKVGGQRGLYSQSEWDSLLQTVSSREKELRAYKTKNNKRESSRFGGGWIIPLLSIKGDKKDSTSKYMQSLIVPKTRANNGRFGADLILGLLAVKKRRLKPQAFRQQH